jgi:hypothetical protein
MYIVDFVYGRRCAEKKSQRFSAESRRRCSVRRQIADHALACLAARAVDRCVQVVGEAKMRPVLHSGR